MLDDDWRYLERENRLAYLERLAEQRERFGEPLRPVPAEADQPDEQESE